MNKLLDDQSVVQRIFDHIDKQTTDLGEQSWREPVENYLSPERFAAEIGSCDAPRFHFARRRRCRRTAPTRARSRGHSDTRGAGERWRRARFSQRLPSSRDAGRHRERMPEGFCVPLPRMDLRARGTPSSRAARIWLSRTGSEQPRLWAPLSQPSEMSGLVFISIKMILEAWSAANCQQRSENLARCTALPVASHYRNRSGGQLENFRRRLSRGLPHPPAASRHFLSGPVR